MKVGLEPLKELRLKCQHSILRDSSLGAAILVLGAQCFNISRGRNSVSCEFRESFK